MGDTRVMNGFLMVLIVNPYCILMYNLGFVEPIFWPSPVRIGLLPDFDDFHLAIGGWTSSGVDEGGDCRSEAVMTAN